MYNKKIRILLAGLSMLLLFACGPKPQAPQAELDTPEHHVSTGNKLLARAIDTDDEARKATFIKDAQREFERAIELDPKFSPAYVGTGLVQGLSGDYKKALKSMTKARDYQIGDEQTVTVNIGFMRLYIMGQEKLDEDWLEIVESNYKKTIKINPDIPEPYFYMGVADKMAFKFQEAADQFSKVLNLNKGYTAAADKEYAIIQKIQRAMPGTKVGKKIALLDKITRGDVAALFIEELRVDELFRNRNKKEFDTSFKSPDQNDFKTGEYVKAPQVTDIADHVLKADIQAVMEVGIKGLQPYPDHTYQPYKTITRAEFAIMVEDILTKVIHDDSLSTKFIGSPSPFPDLRSDLPYFNAVMVCTTRNIMEVKDTATGEFSPMGTISGAEALLSIRALKSQLEKY